MKSKINSFFIMLFMVCYIAIAGADVSVFAAVTSSNMPSFTGKAYVTVHDNVPEFTSSQKKLDSYVKYSKPDSLKRSGSAMAVISDYTLDYSERDDISSIYPTGWLANQGWERCHLIGHKLGGEDKSYNLITGSDYFNVTGMLPFERMISDYVEETGNRVLYRVTPVYKGNNLIASGVQMEALSLDDEDLSFNVYVFNVVPGSVINYKTGLVTEAKLKSSTISLTNKSAYYNGKQIYIPTAKVKGSKGYIVYTYYSDKACTKKVSTHKKAGKYYVRAVLSADNKYNAAVSNVAVLNIKKATQKIRVSSLSTSFKDTQTKSNTKTFKLKTTTTTGNKVFSKQSGSSALSVTNDGIVKVKKGTKAGTYKMKVKIVAEGTTNYKKTSAVKTVTITVKKTAVKKSTTTNTTPVSNVGGTVYWTPSGEVYHYSRNCRTLSRSRTVYSGTISQSNKSRGCLVCG